jgi:hypothetical protein
MSMNAWAVASIRCAGMTLPAKQAGPPLTLLQVPESCGSRMKTSRLRLSRVAEESPRRSRAVGIRR